MGLMTKILMTCVTGMVEHYLDNCGVLLSTIYGVHKGGVHQEPKPEVHQRQQGLVRSTHAMGCCKSELVYLHCCFSKCSFPHSNVCLWRTL